MLNDVIYGDAGKVMSLRMEDESVNLTVTSPPYGELRTYGGHDFDFHNIATQLWRVTAKGGVLVWVCGDALIKSGPRKGSESGLSHKQSEYFMELGFLQWDTMIYKKQNPIPRKQRRYQQQFEYMFVLSKGEPVTFNPIMVPCKYAGVKSTGKFYEEPDTKIPFRASSLAKKKKEKPVIAEKKVMGNVWNYWVGRDTSEKKDSFYHPAKMKLQLAIDHIISWSNPGDVVFDPMCGSGTTLVAAKLLGRRYIGIDCNQDYVDMSKKRLESTGVLVDNGEIGKNHTLAQEDADVCIIERREEAIP